MTHIQPALRKQVEHALAEAKSAPNDAEASGELGQFYVIGDCPVEAAVCFERAATLDPKTMRWPYYLGIAKAAAYDTTGAVRAFEQALTLDSTYEATYVRLGSLLSKSDPTRAKAYLERAVQMNPKDEQAHFGLGECARAAGDIDLALRHYQQAVEVAPKYAAAHNSMAELLTATGQEQEAAKHRKQRDAGERPSSVNDPLYASLLMRARGGAAELGDVQQLLNTGRFEEAGMKLEELMKDRPTPQVRHMLAVVRAQQGRFADAVRLFREILARDQNNIDVTANLAVALANNDQLEEAEPLFTKALQERPDHSTALPGYGELLLLTGRVDQAVATYRKGVEAQPKQAAVRFDLVAALVVAKKTDEAIEEYKIARDLISGQSRPGIVLARRIALLMAIQKEASSGKGGLLDPTDLQSLADRLADRGMKEDGEAVRNYLLVLAAESLGTAERGQFDQAASLLRRVMKIDRGGVLQNALGNVHAMHGKYEEAAKCFRQALEAAPDLHAAKSGLGTVLAGLGKFDEAERLFVEVLEKQPNDVLTMQRFAKLRATQGKNDEALELLSRAAAALPTDAGIQQAWGETLSRMGKNGEAIEHLKRAVEIEPKQAGALYMLGQLAAQAGDVAAAKDYCRQAVKVAPGYVDPYLALAQLAMKQGKEYPEAIRLLRDAMKQVPQSPLLANALAWYLATCPLEALRDGAEAVRLAERASQTVGNQAPEVLDTLAAAYAEAGRFDDAVKTARQAIKLAEEGKSQVDLAGFKSRLLLYEAKKPYHENK